jgi:hypothetical protein
MADSLRISLTQGQTAEIIEVSEMGELAIALEQIGLSDSHPVLVLVGGASQISAADFLRIQSLFVNILAPIAQNLGAYVVDGGTDAGVMHLMGNARKQINGKFPLIGVAPIGKVLLPDQITTSADSAPLEPNHTHFVLIPGNNWGDESPWIMEVATVLSGTASSVTVLINGGEVTFIDALNSVSAERLVIVIAGSGRTADKLAIALQGEPTDERAKDLAASGKLRTIDLSADSQELSHTIINLLSN